MNSSTLKRTDFQRISYLVETNCGIRLPDSKRTMVEGRLRKRVKALGLQHVDEYCRMLFDQGGLHEELVHLLDSVTTNKTDFFREPRHFDFLVDHAVPDLLERGTHPLRIWSAACSSGEEPYTLAMILRDLSNGIGPFDMTIDASDISTRMLHQAMTAIYTEQVASPVPLDMRRRYMLRSRDRTSQRVRMTPEIRSMVAFHYINLLDETMPFSQKMNIVFCRNVLIYFSRETQAHVIEKLVGSIAPGGYLFLGHSESANGLRLPMKQVAPSVYRITDDI